MIAVTNLSMRFGGQILFKNVNLQFNPGCHYGLVGANGCGKSTFIKILTGEITPESGHLSIPAQCSTGFLKQDHYLYENEEILQIVLRGKTKLWKAIEDKKSLLQRNPFTEEDCETLVKLEEIITNEEGYIAASEAAKLLEGLGIREEWHQKPLNFLSGGYKLRVLLAQVFFSRPDILVLDEPTNHLDLFSIKWLEGYLRHFPGTLLISSHDRDFLNGVCTHIADVDYGTIKIYKGHYNAFIDLKKQEREQKEALLLKHDKRRADIQGFIDRFGAKATKARQAQSKARMVEQLVGEMEALDLAPSSRLYPKINFVPLRSSGVIVLSVKALSKSYGIKKVLTDVAFEVERGDRLAIIGPNGIGKSTLLEILTGHVKADIGSFSWGFAARLAYFPQDHTREVQGSVNLLDWLGSFDRDLNQEQLRGILGRVLFSGDKVNQSVNTLSGGETARLILAKLMMQKPNILIFDEPTNHLDMEAIDELTHALQQFDGTVLFVSHNRYFVSQLANRILEINHRGIKDFKCSYKEYLEKQEIDHLSSSISLKQRYTPEAAKEELKFRQTISYEDQKKWRTIKAQLKKKIIQAEETCDQLEQKIKELEDLMASEGFYQTGIREEQQTIMNQKKDLEGQLAAAMEKWEIAELELQESEKQEFA
jgi:ATPase subunit of ABC transporter with duplicated ATPase domains